MAAPDEVSHAIALISAVQHRLSALEDPVAEGEAWAGAGTCAHRDRARLSASLAHAAVVAATILLAAQGLPADSVRVDAVRFPSASAFSMDS